MNSQKPIVPRRLLQRLVQVSRWRGETSVKLILPRSRSVFQRSPAVFSHPANRSPARDIPVLFPSFLLLRETTMSTTLRQRMTQDLQLAGLSTRTQEAYLRAVSWPAQLMRFPVGRRSIDRAS